MNSNQSWAKEIGVELRVFGRFAVSSLLDAMFIALWVLLQWIVEYVVVSVSDPAHAFVTLGCSKNPLGKINDKEKCVCLLACFTGLGSSLHNISWFYHALP
jgi:hypothetical protein